MRNPLLVVCVFVAAAPALAGLQSPSLGGRWQGYHYRMASQSPDCENGRCMITLDIVACGNDWCGIEVDRDNKCGETALKLREGGDGQRGGNALEGSLSLAAGTEPYVVRAYLDRNEGPDGKAQLHMTGDTGGEFRIYRRSFPFHATLARVGDAACKDVRKPMS